MQTQENTFFLLGHRAQHKRSLVMKNIFTDKVK